MDRQTEFKILIIDNDPAIHLNFKKILKLRTAPSEFDSAKSKVVNDYSSYHVDCVLHREEGIHHIQKAIETKMPYTLVFVDAHKSFATEGIETIKRIWALDREIQIVICTDHSDHAWEENLEGLGLRDNLLILSKPFDGISVRQLVYSLTKKWRLMQEAKNREHILEKTINERTASLQETLSILEYQSTHDSLTNLPNRVLLVDRIKQAIARSRRNKAMFAVIFIDLDRFKLINDSFNHESGDMVLKLLSERLSQSTRADDTIARLSGDEFIFMSSISVINKIENIGHLARKILKLINESMHIANRNISISASLGISIYPQDGTSVEELIRNADLAMYRAKILGGSQFQFYIADLQEQCTTHLENEPELRRGFF